MRAKKAKLKPPKKEFRLTPKMLDKLARDTWEDLCRLAGKHK